MFSPKHGYQSLVDSAEPPIPSAPVLAPSQGEDPTDAPAATPASVSRAVACPPPALSPTRQPINSRPSNSVRGSFNNRCIISAGLGALALTAVAVGVLNLLQSNSSSQLPFTGMIETGTCFDNGTLKILPDAYTEFGGKGILQMSGGVTSTYPLACYMNFPDNSSVNMPPQAVFIQEFNFNSSALLIEFAKQIYLNCSGHSTGVNVYAKILDMAGHTSSTLHSLVQYGSCAVTFMNKLREASATTPSLD
jgi:hypothetical protein